MLLLDMVLGNQDRLPLDSLGWRGNPGNLLFCPAGEFRDRTVAIDTLVQRRPPGVITFWYRGWGLQSHSDIASGQPGLAGQPWQPAVLRCGRV